MRLGGGIYTSKPVVGSFFISINRIACLILPKVPTPVPHPCEANKKKHQGIRS